MPADPGSRLSGQPAPDVTSHLASGGSVGRSELALGEVELVQGQSSLAAVAEEEEDGRLLLERLKVGILL